jgi:hypothetical protein
LTHFGGAYFFHESLQLLQFRQLLAQQLHYSRRNRRYSLSQMMAPNLTIEATVKAPETTHSISNDVLAAWLLRAG